MNRAAGNLLTQSKVDEDLVERAPSSADRHDLSAIPWDSWTVDQVIEAPHPSARPDAENTEADSTDAFCEAVQPASVDTSLVDADLAGLADVPWFVWALDHPSEAEHAEAWLRSTEPEPVAQTTQGPTAVATATNGRQTTVTPWMVWALDHPCEAERAEAWLEGAARCDLSTSSDSETTTLEAPARTDVAVAKPVPLWRRAGSAAVTTALVLVLLGVVFLGYGRLDNRWYHLVTVQGGSMEPTYSIGDVLVLTRPPEQIEVGMVLTMQVEGRVVTHRVVEVAEDGSFVTQGDANDFPDDFGGLDVKVVGQVRADLPWIGNYLGTRGSTNAWFVDRATASALASAAIGPESVDEATAVSRTAENDVPAVDETDDTIADDEVTDDTVADRTITDDTITDDTFTDDRITDDTIVSDDAVPEDTVTDAAASAVVTGSGG